MQCRLLHIVYLGASGKIEPPTVAFEIVHRYADKALELDNTIAESHIAKASAYLFYDWKWKEANDALQKAIELNPGAVEAYELLGFYYILAMGPKRKGCSNAGKSRTNGSTLPRLLTQSLGNVYIFAERFDDAIRQAEKMLEIDPQMRCSYRNERLGCRNER